MGDSVNGSRVKLSLPEVKEAELDILLSFDRFCRDKGLRYCLIFGTLLGAVRHEGFIPWDDDIDVAMPRPDYEVFIDCAKKGMTPDGLGVRSFELDGLQLYFAKVVNRSISVDSGTTVDGEREHLWIDVFPVDGGYASESDRRRSSLKEKVLATVATAGRINPSFDMTTLTMRASAFCLGSMVRRFPVISTHALNALIRSRCSIPFERAKLARVGLGANGTFPVHYFSEFDEVVFEGHRFPAPLNSGEVLSVLYGDDYMELPPIEARVTHQIEAYCIKG